ncbi:MAG: DUF2779 domain-containing protein [bacterium]|nr:DUF2779 domain-containing protein [bacterium]
MPPNPFPPIDPAKQAIFDIGHAVGDLAKQLYPDGVEVPWSRDLAKTTAGTRELLPQRKPIFEASFAIDGCYCRADIMVPRNDDTWDLYEVKSATKVKDVNIADVAFQTHAIERSGVKLDRLYLVHVDNSYVRRGDIEPEKLFHAEDVTSRARALQPEVESKVAEMQRIISGACPDIAIGTHCSDPYECDLQDQCSAFLPEFNVTQLYRAHKSKIFDLIERGITAMVDVPPSELSPDQLIQQCAIASGKAHVDRKPIRAWLDSLEYPLHCLDFETMNPAVPIIDGTRPYQQIPFQFSLHTRDREGAAPRHIEFLAESALDPRPAFLEALQTIGSKGTVLAYNMGFERRILRELAEDFPAYGAFVTDLDGRFQDLIIPFNQFWYYDAKQRGSCSLKRTLPVLTDTTYDGMEISEGGQAMREYQRVVYGGVATTEKERVLRDLRDYCKQDTAALLDILDALEAKLK